MNSRGNLLGRSKAEFEKHVQNSTAWLTEKHGPKQVKRPAGERPRHLVYVRIGLNRGMGRLL